MLTEKQKQEADTRATSYEIWEAILKITTGQRSSDDIWNGPTETELTLVLEMAHPTGEIDEKILYWGENEYKVKN